MNFYKLNINLIFAGFKKLLKIYLIMYKPTKLKELKHLILSSWKNMNLTFCELRKAPTQWFFLELKMFKNTSWIFCKLQNAQKMHLILGEIQKLMKKCFFYSKISKSSKNITVAVYFSPPPHFDMSNKFLSKCGGNLQWLNYLVPPTLTCPINVCQKAGDGWSTHPR